jgi:ketosteroid isomerase-like protein
MWRRHTDLATWTFARGMYSATLVPKAGGAQIPIDGKFLTILARQPDGSWKIWRDIFNSNQPPPNR